MVSRVQARIFGIRTCSWSICMEPTTTTLMAARATTSSLANAETMVLNGGADDDHVFGDNASNIVPQYTDIPKILHTYRVIDTDVTSILLPEMGAVIEVPFTKLPEEMELNNPYRLRSLASSDCVESRRRTS